MILTLFIEYSFKIIREHAAELGNKVPVGNPIIFSKPSTSIITQGSPIMVNI